MTTIRSTAWLTLVFILLGGLFLESVAQEQPGNSEVAEGTVQTPPPSEPAPPEALAPGATAPSESAEVSSLKDAPRLTLWDMIRAGGIIMWIIILMSVVTGIIAVYFLMVVTPAREIPPTFVKRAMQQIRAGDLRGAYQMCEGRDELVANVLRAGLKVAGHDRYVIQEAMESEGERGATQLWEKISYLNYVGVTAPLVGLLGTVWGMINAFGAIAFEDAIARGKAMASGVAQAMVTTAGGLMLAIPAFVLYFYLRGRVIKIIAHMESLAGEMVEILSRSDRS